MFPASALIPLSIPPDAGAGSGGAAGAAPSGSSTTGDAAGGASAFRLSDDALIDPGDGKPVKYGDYRNSRYMERDAYDRGVQYLQTEAQRLQTFWNNLLSGKTKLPTAPQQQQTQQQPRDPFGSLRGKPVVDGDSVVQLAEQMQREGFGPLAQTIAAMGTKIQQLEAQLQGTRGELAPMNEQRARADFDRTVTKSIGEVGQIKGLPEGVTLPADDPWVRDMAEDLYSSHEQESWRPGEFTKHLKARLEGAISFVRAVDKGALEQGRQLQRSRLFPNLQKGSGRGSGQPKYQFQRGEDIAKIARDAGLFGGGQSST